MDITITTCLYDIRAKEANNEEEIRSVSQYFELGKHMLAVRLPMVVYTDNQEVVDEVKSERARHGLEDITTIVWLPFEETLFYEDMEALQERMNEYELCNWNRKKDTPLYVTLNNNKFDFLTRTMDTNPYQSSFFLWMDYGIQHCAKASPEEWEKVWTEWPGFIKQETEKIHHLRIHTATKAPEIPWKDYFKVIYHHIAGSLFGGHQTPLREYVELYKQQWKKIIYEEKWWQLDEAVMTIVVETHPEKFRLWYGDYDGLITNFIHSQRSWYLVFQTAQRHLDGRKYDQSELVLRTLDPVMKEKIDDKDFYKYFSMRLCNDFYKWKSSFSDALYKLLFECNIPDYLIQCNIKNIKYYNDKLAMKFFSNWVFQDPQNISSLQKFKDFCGEITSNQFQWVAFGNSWLAKNVANKLGVVSINGPFDNERILPDQMVKLFRSQFDFLDDKSVFEASINQLYQLLQTQTPNKTILLHTTGLFMTDDFSVEDNIIYDKKLVELCSYIKRNFPALDFMLLCIYTNRDITIPKEELPPKMIVLSIETPNGYIKSKNEEFISNYNEAILQTISSLF